MFRALLDRLRGASPADPPAIPRPSPAAPDHIAEPGKMVPPEPIAPVIISRLTARDRERLVGVHRDLALVVDLAAQRWTEGPLFVIEGLRTPARQAELVRSGASKTQDSRHLTGHAVDLAWTVDGKVPWDDWPAWQRLGAVVKQAADDLGVVIVWGGDWRTFRDGPHFELSRSIYPA